MKRITSILLFVLSCTVAFPASACWGDAKWIWTEEDGQANSWVAFRKTFDLNKSPKEAVAKIAVDTKYWLWVNGEMVLFEGGLARGAAPNTNYYDEVDLSEYLTKGENTISILVWYWGRTRKTHEDSGMGGLIFYSDIDGTLVESDQSWKIKKHSGYDTNSGGGGSNANRVNAYNIRFNANLGLGDWSDKAWYTTAYNDNNWGQSSIKGEADCAPWGKLVERAIPQWNDRGLVDYTSLNIGGQSIVLPYTNTTDSTIMISAKLPFNKQVTPYLKIDAKKNDKIVIDTDNGFNMLTSTYIAIDGEQEFEGYSWFNGHNIEYNIPAGVKVEELKYRWTGVGEIRGDFECSDPDLSKLWWMARNTLYICARDGYMDCPDRERGFWVGDVADQTGAVFYTLDNAGILLLKKGLDNTIAYRDGDIIQGLAPGFGDYRGKSSELTGQSLQYIDQGIWQYYFNTGDKATLANAYPAVLSYLKLWSMQPDGLPEHRKGYANWVDWGVDSDPTPTNVILYYMALKSAKNMAIALDATDDIAWYDSRILSIENNFENKYWQGTYYGTKDHALEERATALAVLSGLAKTEHYEVIVEKTLFPLRKASPHMEWIVEAAIMETGQYDVALQRTKEVYGPQIKDPNLTTLYEKFDDQRPGTPNHAWNAPNYVLSRYIAGIRAISVGWSRFEVRPVFANLSTIKQVVPSVKGEIVMNASKQDDNYTIELSSPKNTTAVVNVPICANSTIRLNNKIIWKDGEYQKKDSNKLKYLGADDQYAKFEVTHGDWTFKSNIL